MAAIEVTAAPLRKLCFMVLNSGTSDLGDCATPLMHALTASAMECDVEMHFIGPGVRLLAAGAADSVLAGSPPRPLGALLDEARNSGVRIHACTSAWKAHVPSGSALGPQSAGFAGAATYLGRALDPAWRVLSY